MAILHFVRAQTMLWLTLHDQFVLPIPLLTSISQLASATAAFACLATKIKHKKSHQSVMRPG
jgi:hypothetical protein